MKLLTIDTSTTACSAALTNDTRIIGEYFLDTEKNLSRQLLTAIDALMDMAGITVDAVDGVGVALGPGSFTGLRVGIATAKGLALATDKPIVGFSSLAMLALNLPWSPYAVCPMLDARKNEVYTALYRCCGFPVALVEDCVVSPAVFLETITEPTIFVGTGAVRYRALIESILGEKAIFPPSYHNQPRASIGAYLAYDALLRGPAMPVGLLNPTYLRPSEAELQKLTQKL